MKRSMAASRYRPSRKLNWKLIVLIVLFHIVGLYLLARLLAPQFTASVIEQATSLVTVTVATYEEPEPEIAPSTVPEPEPDEGAAAEEGREAVAREVVAPKPVIPPPTPRPAPRASSTGAANASGARDQGEGTGAGGAGDGTGAGRYGSGRGGIPVSGPSVKSGRIDAARDFPIPAGGRQARYGTSVTVVFTVGVDGRARDCSVRDPGPDPATNALVCPLVIERIRFNPAIDANGDAVAAPYGWRQDFFRP